MKAPALATIITASGLLSGCSYGAETLPLCFNENIQPSERAIKQVSASGAYRGGDIDLKHTLCSTHEDRLAVAEQLLATSGYSFQRHIAELGSCIEVQLKSPLTSQALKRQVTTFCGIAAAARVAYTDWSGEVGNRFLFVSGNYISFTGPGELPKGL